MEEKLKKILCVLLLAVFAAVSFFFFADAAADAETYRTTVESLDKMTDTVLTLAASSALASAGVSAMPGDTATPIAEKLADFSEYFLLILCVLYTEKFLLTLIGGGTFKVLIPAACALFAVGLFKGSDKLNRLAGKLLIFGLTIVFVIPLSVKASDTIYELYSASLEETIETAEAFTDKTAALTEADADKSLLDTVLNTIAESASSLANKAAKILNGFVESLAVLIVTTCIIPLVVLLFCLWLVKQLTGLDLFSSLPRLRRRHRAL